MFLPVDHKRSAGASGGAAAAAAAAARYDFKLPTSPALRKALGTILSGPVGSAIAECLGEDSAWERLFDDRQRKGRRIHIQYSNTHNTFFLLLLSPCPE